MLTEERIDIPATDDQPDLASLERLTYSRRFSDGSMDVMFGLGVLLVGITWLFDRVDLGAAVPAILIPLWLVLHKQVVLPRTGYAEPTEERLGTEKRSLALTIILGVLLFLQFGVAALGGGVLDMIPDSVVEIVLPGVPAALVALFAMVGGLITRQKEGTAYAQALIAIGLIGGMNGLEPGTILTISGGVILVLALRKFAAFLSSSARPDDD